MVVPAEGRGERSALALRTSEPSFGMRQGMGRTRVRDPELSMGCVPRENIPVLARACLSTRELVCLWLGQHRVAAALVRISLGWCFGKDLPQQKCQTPNQICLFSPFSISEATWNVLQVETFRKEVGLGSWGITSDLEPTDVVSGPTSALCSAEETTFEPD